MTWRDRIDPELRGSYRGVEFHVERSDTTAGRRWQVHEYPRRDVPYTEDMGRKARQWQLSLFVAGDDYDLARDALIEALDAPGAATLVHPYVGRVSAVATDVRVSESTREGGVCTFDVTFAESGLAVYPATTVDTAREVATAAGAVEELSIADFARRWSVEGLTGWSLSSIERDIRAIVGGLESIVSGIADRIADVIRFPINIAGILLGGYNRIRGAVMRPINALALYTGVSPLSSNAGTTSTSTSTGAATTSTGPRAGAGAVAVAVAVGNLQLPPGPPRRAIRMLRDAAGGGDAVSVPPSTTPENTQRAGNIVAARQLNGRIAATAGARIIAETDWLSRNDAQAAGRDVIALIDHELETDEPIDDRVYVALTTLRAAVTTDLRRRIVALPDMSEYTPQTTLPAVVIAQRLYGDATRADEICVRNNIRHPGALRGGMPLEVLSE